MPRLTFERASRTNLTNPRLHHVLSVSESKAGKQRWSAAANDESCRAWRIKFPQGKRIFPREFLPGQILIAGAFERKKGVERKASSARNGFFLEENFAREWR